MTDYNINKTVAIIVGTGRGGAANHVTPINRQMTCRKPLRPLVASRS
ncbi:hypothetical protein [Amycolatopsis sp. NPDC059657]